MVNPPKPPEKPKPTKAQFRHQFQIQSEDNIREYCSQGAPPPPRPQAMLRSLRSATPPFRKIHALGALRSIRSSLFTKPHEHLYDDLALRYL